MLPPTKRLCQVLSALLEGDTEQQIADKLEISFHTVNRHVQRLFELYEVSSARKLQSLWKDRQAAVELQRKILALQDAPRSRVRGRRGNPRTPVPEAAVL